MRQCLLRPRRSDLGFPSLLEFGKLLLTGLNGPIYAGA